MLGPVQRRDLALGRDDRILHGVELGLELVDLGDLAPVSLHDLGRHPLRRIEEAPQILHGRENLADPAIPFDRQADALARERLLDPIAFSGVAHGECGRTILEATPPSRQILERR
jgi:hypothetical protein